MTLNVMRALWDVGREGKEMGVVPFVHLGELVVRQISKSQPKVEQNGSSKPGRGNPHKQLRGGGRRGLKKIEKGTGKSQK